MDPVSQGGVTINDLANELLVSIFLSCCPSYTTIPPDPATAPWNISLVNVRWRTIALDVPSLWDRIKFDFRQASNPLPPADFDQLSSHTTTLALGILKRLDQDRLLSISNDEAIPYDSRGQENLESFMPNFVAFIKPISHRLRRLDFQSDCYKTFDFLLALPAGSFPALEEVLFNFRTQSYRYISFATRGAVPPAPNDQTKSSAAFQCAHLLSKVTFQSQYGQIDLTHLDLPWHGLTSLHFIKADVLYTSLPHILSTCQNLADLRLGISDSAAPPSFVLPHSPFLSLRQLDYRISESSVGFLSSFEFPNLEYLTLRLTTISWDVEAFNTFANQSCHRLEGLNLVFNVAGGSLTYLQAIFPPLLDVLSFIGAPIEDCRLLCSYVPRTVYTKIVEGAFPALTKFTVNTPTQASVRDALGVVEALNDPENDRAGGGQRKLDVAAMIIRLEMEEESVKKVEELRAKGVDLRVRKFESDWDESPQWDEPF